MILRILI